MGVFGGIADGFKTYGPMALPVAGALGGALLAGPGGYAMGSMLGGSIGAGMGNMWQNVQNYNMQQSQFDYQKNLQKQIFDREDNAIWRRTQDLIRSGLSPVLAAGSGASSGSVVSTHAPQREMTPDIAGMMMSLLKMKEDISLTQAQKELTEVNSAIKNWDLNKYVEWNLPSNASGLAKTIRDLGSMLGGISNQAKPVIDELQQKLVPEGTKNPYQRKFTPQSDPIQDFFIQKGWLPKPKR